ncbi:MAG TPA: TonB family protein [Longimicrobium sp.]|nr:TonB family protein [Longimicrobium sp.]
MTIDRIRHAARTATRGTALAALLLGALPAAARAQYQRVGDFHVRPASRSAQALAAAFPDSAVGYGALLWACDGDGVLAGLRLNRGHSHGTLVDVELRFDGGEKETLRLLGAPARSVWIASAADAARLAERARTAQRLVVAVPRDTAAGSEAEYAYSLAGAGEALDRLACARATRARLPGLQVLAAASYAPWVNRGRVTDANPWSMPVLENPQGLLAALRRAAPPSMMSEARNVEATVRFRVRADGSVDSASVSVVRSSGRTRFDAVAVEAVRRLRFSPGTWWGRADDFWVDQPLSLAMLPRRLESGAAGGMVSSPRTGAPSGCNPSGGRC